MVIKLNQRRLAASAAGRPAGQLSLLARSRAEELLTN